MAGAIGIYAGIVGESVGRAFLDVLPEAMVFSTAGEVKISISFGDAAEINKTLSF